MADPGLPERQPSAGNRLQQGSNALSLDEARLALTSRQIRDVGLTRDQLNAIYFGEQDRRNPLLIVWIDDTAQLQAEHMGLDGRSFRRGAALALYLISESSTVDRVSSIEGIPFMGMDARIQAGTYLKQPPDSDALLSACDTLLDSQTELSRSFDEALGGVPEGTDSVAARFGGGVALLGVMSAAQFGGAHVEVYLPE